VTFDWMSFWCGLTIGLMLGAFAFLGAMAHMVDERRERRWEERMRELEGDPENNRAMLALMRAHHEGKKLRN
jgi:MFS superfamily sulfate permease-like transporter